MNAQDDEGTSDTEKSKFRIFIDANALIPFFSQRSKSEVHVLHVLATATDSDLLTTDLTRIEVAKHLAGEDCKLLQPTQNPHTRELAREELRVHIPTLDMESFYLKRYRHHKERVKNATCQGRWKCLKTRKVRLKNIYSQYGKKIRFVFRCQQT